ncbi:MAG: DUF1801 domain-containing protein [Bacteroidota bacterium]
MNNPKTNKMQSVSFRNVEEFLDYLPEELKIVLTLRQLIFECIPTITEKLSFNVPFYFGNKSMFFIWPASILWGKKKSYEGVRFGFSYGVLMQNEENYLDLGDRKQVAYKDFKSLSEIDFDYFKALIFEAFEIDKEFKKTKNADSKR